MYQDNLDETGEIDTDIRQQLDSYYGARRLGQESQVVAHHQGVTQCVALSPNGQRA